MPYINLQKIRELRKKKGLTQTEISKALGYKSVQGYHYIEKGRSSIKADQLIIIASLLGVTVEDLYSKRESRTTVQSA